MVYGAKVQAGRRPERVRRLNDASAARYRPIEDLVAGRTSAAQLVPDELLSVAGLELKLSPQQRRTLATEEVASIILVGLNFEAVLGTGFAYAMATASSDELVSDEAIFFLHQLGEETRHSRVFIGLLNDLAPTARNPFSAPPLRRMRGAFVRWAITKPLFFQSLVLGGEEIPDLVQKLVSDHPDSDPHLAAVAGYHRSEEARHMVFARLSFAGFAKSATIVDRAAVRWFTPLVLWLVWDSLVHPGVYRTVGLPPWRTWFAVRREPTRVALRQEATRPVLDSLVEAGVLGGRRVPFGWRALCGVPARSVAPESLAA